MELFHDLYKGPPSCPMLWLLVLLSDDSFRREAGFMKRELADLSKGEVMDHFLPLDQSLVQEEIQEVAESLFPYFGILSANMCWLC